VRPSNEWDLRLRKWTKAEKEQVAVLRDKGLGPKAIADKTGFPLGQIRFWIYKRRPQKKVPRTSEQKARGRENSLWAYYRMKYNDWFAWKAQTLRSSLLKRGERADVPTTPVRWKS